MLIKCQHHNMLINFPLRRNVGGWRPSHNLCDGRHAHGSTAVSSACGGRRTMTMRRISVKCAAICRYRPFVPLPTRSAGDKMPYPFR
ncbi:MAG: hypothetical protein HXL36_08425 [Prevotellaceae bacterium]|nr:hypothetical protein [Prevotellaceae bacterium]